MTNRIKQFDAIVTILETIEVDGEMMEYIINQCGMREQMIYQLTHSLTNETNSCGTFAERVSHARENPGCVA